MNRQEKHQFVQDFSAQLQKSSAVLVISHVGLSVKELEFLRKSLRSSHASVRMVKNALVRKCIDFGAQDSFSHFLNGSTLFILGSDLHVSAMAKSLVEFVEKNEKVSVCGGVLLGEKLTAGAVKDLASLPSLDQLRMQLLGLLQSPARHLLTCLNQSGERMVRVLQARVDQAE